MLGPFCAAARAAVKVGDKPQLEVTSVDGEQISLEALGGKMVAVHFWATWCPACMGEAEHMVKLHEKYGPRGLVIVGVSWDKDEAALKRVVRAKNFAWPHYRDAEEKVIAAWGVKNTAYAVLISPDGKVLWQGLTWDIDKPLDQAFRQHPPRREGPGLRAEGKRRRRGAQGEGGARPCPGLPRRRPQGPGPQEVPGPYRRIPQHELCGAGGEGTKGNG
jgi:peroxiredoxin